MPASTDDCREVGGSSRGCGTGTRSGTAKSRAADCPGKPSFTPVVLALSLSASVEGGTARDPVPFPRDTASASLLRAVRVFCWSFNFSMEPTEFANKVKALQAVQDNKHALWLRRPRCIRNGTANILGLALKAWQWGLGSVMPQLAQRLQPPFATSYSANRGDRAGMLLADHELTRCASPRCESGGACRVQTPGPTPYQSVKDLKHTANPRVADRDPRHDLLAKRQRAVLQVDAMSRTRITSWDSGLQAHEEQPDQHMRMSASTKL